jgi:hypothetical protein
VIILSADIGLNIICYSYSMLFTAIRQGARRQALNATRSFSSSTNKLAAAEVKKLGVIGAGQMVSSYLTCLGEK